MKIGFTGSQLGMNDSQRAQLFLMLWHMEPEEFHFGDCIGSDKQAFHIVETIRPFKPHSYTVIHSHPPIEPRKRAFCQANVTHPCKPYLIRDKEIVDVVDILIATPAFPEIIRSGTWATIRYARKINQTRIILMP